MDDTPIICNKCGKNCAKPIRDLPMQSNYGLLNVSFCTGYFSEKFQDCEKITFSMCEECLFELFITFSIMPTVQETDVFEKPITDERLLFLDDGVLK